MAMVGVTSTSKSRPQRATVWRENRWSSPSARTKAMLSTACPAS